MWRGRRRPAARPRTVPQLELLESRNLLSGFAAPPPPPTLLTPVQSLVVHATTLFISANTGATAETLKEELKPVRDDYNNLPSLINLSTPEISSLFIAGTEVSGAAAIMVARSKLDLSVAKLAAEMVFQGIQIMGTGELAVLAIPLGFVNSEQRNLDSNPSVPVPVKNPLDSIFDRIKKTIHDNSYAVMDRTGTTAYAAEIDAATSPLPPLPPPPPVAHDPDNDGDVDMY